MHAWTEDDYAVSRVMEGYFANFIKTGDPNGPGLPQWPAVGDRAELMELGDRMAPIPAAPSPQKLQFFETFLMR